MWLGLGWSWGEKGGWRGREEGGVVTVVGEVDVPCDRMHLEIIDTAELGAIVVVQDGLGFGGLGVNCTYAGS